jgi:hypothetical protein
MDIFNSNAFSMTSLTAAIEKVPYVPGFLGTLGLFTPNPVRTPDVWVEERTGVLSLIQTSARAAPLTERTQENRVGRNFKIPRIAKGSTIRADEIQSIRAFGSETEFMQVQAEVVRRLDGPAGILREIELTWENMRLGAAQGILLDADGSTIFNYFTEFNVTQATEIAFDLTNASPASGAVRRVCQQVIRQMMRAAAGAWIDGPGGTYVLGLCSDTFWDDLTANSEVRSTYLNQQEAGELRGVAAFQQFNYGGITFVNYRGTDDNSTVAVPADKAKFIPVNAPGVFQVSYAPAETFDYANTLGQDRYAMIVPDRDRNAWVRVEGYSYPLFICTRPLMLQRGRRGA